MHRDNRIHTLHGERVVLHVSEATYTNHALFRADHCLEVRLTFAVDAFVVIFPYHTRAMRKTVEQESTGLEPHLLRTRTIREITDHVREVNGRQVCPALGWPADPQHWGQVTLTDGLSISYLMLLRENHNLEDAHLATLRTHAKELHSLRRTVIPDAKRGRTVKDGQLQRSEAWSKMRRAVWAQFVPWMDSYFKRAGNAEHSITRARERCAEHFNLNLSTVKRRTANYERPRRK